MSIIRILILISIFISIKSFSFSFKTLFSELKRLAYQDYLKNPYKVLGLAPWTSMKKIKKKYNELVKKYHPDKNEGNREYFELIQSAFERIKKERKEMEEEEDDLNFSSVIRGTISKILNIEVLFAAACGISYIIYKFQSLIYVQLFYMVISFTIIDNLCAQFFSEELFEYIVCVLVGWFLYTRHKNFFQSKKKKKIKKTHNQ